MSNVNIHMSTDIHAQYIFLLVFAKWSVSSHNDINTKYTVTLKSMCKARYESIPTEGRDAPLFLSVSYEMQLSKLICPKYTLQYTMATSWRLIFSPYSRSQIKNCKCRMQLFFYILDQALPESACYFQNICSCAVSSRCQRDSVQSACPPHVPMNNVMFRGCLVFRLDL